MSARRGGTVEREQQQQQSVEDYHNAAARCATPVSRAQWVGAPAGLWGAPLHSPPRRRHRRRLLLIIPPARSLAGPLAHLQPLATDTAHCMPVFVPGNHFRMPGTVAAGDRPGDSIEYWAAGRFRAGGFLCLLVCLSVCVRACVKSSVLYVFVAGRWDSINKCHSDNLE